MPAIVVVGAQWGDEGKAKIIDWLAERADWVIRYQGGCNAGHTVVCNGETFKFHLIPSGSLYPNATCLIGPGTVISVDVLQSELAQLHARNIPLGKLFISPKAHVTLPYHLELDGLKEDSLGAQNIGTTRRGIGPTYEDKITRIGLRVGDLFLDETQLTERLQQIIAQKNPVLTQLYQLPALTLSELQALALQYRKILAPYVQEPHALVQQALRDGKAVLLEGAQGTMLDLDHGTYPFVTSSTPSAGGACAGAGIGPKAIDRVIGVTKVYTTRVGSGPFPTELLDEIGTHLATVGHEVGTTTGRARRVGWFDAVAMRYAAEINSLDGLAITKLDVLDGLSEIKLATGYTHRETGEAIEVFPSQVSDLAMMMPVYETLPGWTGSVKTARTWAELPVEAQTLLQRIAQLTHTPISLVSVGPGRDETIVLDSILPEKQLAAASI
jgi:adenylosuccinate synthase